MLPCRTRTSKQVFLPRPKTKLRTLLNTKMNLQIPTSHTSEYHSSILISLSTSICSNLHHLTINRCNWTSIRVIELQLSNFYMWFHRPTYQDDKATSKKEIQDEEPTKGNDVNSYDELLKQYYELEEKRQTILQQLYTHPSYYDQTLQPDTYNATPEHAAQNPQYLNTASVGCCLPVSVVPMTGGNSCGPCNPCLSICQICKDWELFVFITPLLIELQCTGIALVPVEASHVCLQYCIIFKRVPNYVSFSCARLFDISGYFICSLSSFHNPQQYMYCLTTIAA